MISSLQNFLQKHHKLLFGTLLIIIVIAFVFTIGAPGVGLRHIKHSYLYGRDLSDAHESDEMRRDVLCSAVLNGENLMMIQGNMSTFLFKRVIFLGMAEELGIPFPAEEDLKVYIRSLPAFVGDDGKFSKDLYSSFIDMFKKMGFDEDRISRIACEDFLIKQVKEALVGNGFISENMIRNSLKQYYDQYDFSVITVKNNEDTSNIDISDEEIVKEYNEHKGKYKQPEMFAVSMVKFENEKYEKLIPEPRNEELMAFFEENKENFEDGAKFIDIKPTVYDSYINAKAYKMAYADADSLVRELYDGNIALNSDEFKAALKKKNVNKENVALYSKKKLPSVNGISSTYLTSVCDLDETRYYTDPCPASFGYVVLFREGKKDECELTMEEARDTIKEVLSKRKSREIFVKKLENIRLNLLSKSCEDTSKEFDLQCENFPDISFANSEEKEINQMYLSAIGSLREEGEVAIYPMDENEVLMLKLLKKKGCILEKIPADDLRKTKDIMIAGNKEYFLMDFFFNRFGELSSGRHMKK